jgi:hypothetical protein
VVDLLIGLDSFRDDVQTEPSREVDHSLDDRGVGGVGCHSQDEAAIDLDRVQGEVPEQR